MRPIEKMRGIVCLALVHAGVLLQAQVIDPKSGLADPDGKTVWYDGSKLVVEGRGWTNTASYYDRLPASASNTVPAPVWRLGRNSAGIAIRFATAAPFIQVRWELQSDTLAMPHMAATGVSGIDLYARREAGPWLFAGNGRPKGKSGVASFTLTEGSECMLYLPLYNGVKTIEIGVPHDKSIARPKQNLNGQRKPVVFYGTSITQGACASRPGMAATAMVGRALDLPIINLGFSGSGKMEPEMADLLAELDPSLYVLDCLWNMTPHLVAERVDPFVRKLRATHPTTPILLAEDSSYKNISPTEKGLALRKVYDRLIQEGMKDLYLLPNVNMLGNDSDGTVDGCHPNDVGMLRQAAVFTKALLPLLPTTEQQPANKTPVGRDAVLRSE